jgi:allantoate deiminase
MRNSIAQAHHIIERSKDLARYTEEPGRITRTFLSPPMRDAHTRLQQWMEAAGMTTHIDAAGNLRGFSPGAGPQVLYVGSHIDTVRDAGAFDGVLGVILAIALVETLENRPLPFGIEVVAFSDEEGVRFGVPFIGSRALAGTLDQDLLARPEVHRKAAQGKTVADAIRDFGLDPAALPQASIQHAAIQRPALGYLEFHIEQGPVLEQLNLPLGIVESIVGQSRFEILFTGQPNHAGTTPTALRRDALAGAAEWIGRVEREACTTPDLRATVGCLEVSPGASNVIPGSVRATLDVRHPRDDVRRNAIQSLLTAAEQIAARRGLGLSREQRLDQPATPLDPAMIAALERAVARCGLPVHRLASGAGHDAMILAPCCPAAMLFLRTPGGISHHPGETVMPEDVAAALAVGGQFLREMEVLRA